MNESMVGHPQAATEDLEPLWERFWSLVDASGDCWEWCGYRGTVGYGTLWVRDLNSNLMAHRVAWELLVGPIPDGLQIDHLCRNRACVNPDHLEPVTPAENSRRVPRPRPGICLRGHTYDEANTYVTKDGRRRCRTCRQAREHQAMQRRRNARRASSP